MKKIISLFQRNYDGDRLVRPEIVPGAEWVLAGEGVPTRKFDGTAVMIKDRGIYKRYDLPLLPRWERESRKKDFPGPYTVEMYCGRPAAWVPCQDPDLPDPQSGHWPGWLPCLQEDPADQWALEAFIRHIGTGAPATNGTYELIGPKIQRNPEQCQVHLLIRHGEDVLEDFPIIPNVTPQELFAEVKEYLATHDIEGIVWHGAGRMVKIKAKDFGLKRGLIAPTLPQPSGNDAAALMSTPTDRDMYVQGRFYPAGTITVVDVLDHAARAAGEALKGPPVKKTDAFVSAPGSQCFLPGIVSLNVRARVENRTSRNIRIHREDQGNNSEFVLVLEEAE